ncbi:MAG: hypothetical protein LBQ83_01630 [Candidatus Margulisbacteria bacterium]|jgi:hypothetical protein|nr:hypothetical protein [Candidatus Margulisiibacteriota bacterium]
MKKAAALLLIFCLGTGLTPDLPSLTLEKSLLISELDKNPRQYERRKTLVQLKGAVTHQDTALNNWAFLEDDSGTVLLDFSAASPNIRLPRKAVGSAVIVEGRVSLDETVLNGYVLVPATYSLLLQELPK